MIIYELMRGRVILYAFDRISAIRPLPRIITIGILHMIALNDCCSVPKPPSTTSNTTGVLMPAIIKHVHTHCIKHISYTYMFADVELICLDTLHILNEVVPG
jgi:hypothetical protein